MLKALQHHRQNPNLPEHKGWFLVYSRKQEWIESIPREYCVEGAISMEDIDNDLRGQQRKWRKRLAKAEPELGRFSVKRRQGEIWVKHVGILPETDQHNNWG